MKSSFFALGFFLLALTGCSRTELETPSSDQQQRASLENQARQTRDSFAGASGATLKNSRLEGNDQQGRPLWRLEAREIRAQGALAGGTPKTATLLEAKTTFFAKGQPDSTFSAPRILLFNGEKGLRLLFPDGVLARSGGKSRRQIVTLNAPRADLDVTRKLVHLSGGVEARQDTLLARSATLRARSDLASVEMEGGVKAQNPEGALSAQSAIYNWRTSQLRAKKATLTRAQITLSGGVLEADTAARRGVLRADVRLQSGNGTANAPVLRFDFLRDRIESQNARFENKGVTGTAQTLQTDARGSVARVTGLQLEKDGAVLRAQIAEGFNGLSQLSAQNIQITRLGQTLVASRAQTRDWSTPFPWVQASGGVSIRTSRGLARAPSVSLQNGQIRAENGVEFQADEQTLRAQSGQCDTDFKKATLRGRVRASLRGGATLEAPLLEKRGEKIAASGGVKGALHAGASRAGDFGTLHFFSRYLETDTGTARIVADGGVQIRAQNGATLRASRAVMERLSQTLTATGNVRFFDPTRGLTQNGTALCANWRLREVVLENPQGQMKGVDGKQLF